MSRVAKNPISVPSDIQVHIEGKQIKVQGKKGYLEHTIHPNVEVSFSNNVLTFAPFRNSQAARALAGTTRAVVYDMVQGMGREFEKKLILIGVGYRAQVQESTLNLTVGFSHPINFPIPIGITVETPSQTEILVKGVDKQLVGQVAANIRAFRPPEPYKGKGIRYEKEILLMKEAKKK